MQQNTQYKYVGKGRREKFLWGSWEPTSESNLTTHAGDTLGAYVSIDTHTWMSHRIQRWEERHAFLVRLLRATWLGGGGHGKRKYVLPPYIC